ncbi:MAG: ABC transporter substrate-binding protein [Lentisphaeria bacterium]|nr:ABC transporter substrate-binding protein [Lentisphaeria bacterium]
MKNGIIAVFALICIFFLLNALGVFQFGSIIDRNHRTWYESARAKAVADSPVLKLGTAYDKADGPAAEAIQGVELAMEMLNRKGGVLGKKIELVKRDDIKSQPQYSFAIQDFCDDFEMAAVIGPFSSGYIPAARALTQFQGLPLVSALTVSSEKLPLLEPDNFITFFPPLELWVEAILSDAAQRGEKNLLIISPETDTYGDIFCTALERASRRRSAFDRVYRLNYQCPLRMRDLQRAIQNYTGEHFSSAVFFGGTFADFPEFIALLNELKLTPPVYGSDDLYIPQVTGMTLPFPLFLPRAALRKKETPFMAEWRKRFRKDPSYHTILGAESIFAIAEALNRNGSYDVEKVVSSLREIRENDLRDPEKATTIAIDEFPHCVEK